MMKQIFLTFILSFFGSSLMAAAPIDHIAQGQSTIIVKSAEPEVKVEAAKEVPVPAPEVLVGFQAWKQQQVFKARATLETFKTPKPEEVVEGAAQAEEAVENSEEKAEIEQIQKNQAERLRQLEFNLEIALGLTIHDYFSLYLKNKSKEELAMVIPKLSPAELSELLVAYRKALDGVPVIEKSNQKAIQPNL